MCYTCSLLVAAPPHPFLQEALKELAGLSQRVLTEFVSGASQRPSSPLAPRRGRPSLDSSGLCRPARHPSPSLLCRLNRFARLTAASRLLCPCLPRG